jgi:hypothetical protein
MNDMRKARTGEIELIRKQFLGEYVFFSALMAVSGLLTLCIIPSAIKAMVDKGSVSFAVISIILQLFVVALAAILFKMSIDLAGKVKDLKDNRIMVSDCTVDNVSVKGTGKHMATVVTVEKEDGTKETLNTLKGSDCYHKNMRALLISYPSQYGKNEAKDVCLCSEAMAA